MTSTIATFLARPKPTRRASFFTLPDAALPGRRDVQLHRCHVRRQDCGRQGLHLFTGTAASTTDQMACTLAVRLSAAGLGGYGNYAAGAAAYSTQLVNLLSRSGQRPPPGLRDAEHAQARLAGQWQEPRQRPLSPPALGFAGRRADAGDQQLCDRHLRHRLRQARLRPGQAGQPDHTFDHPTRFATSMGAS